MHKTIAFFENKGLKKVKEDDHARAWYADLLPAFQIGLCDFKNLVRKGFKRTTPFLSCLSMRMLSSAIE